MIMLSYTCPVAIFMLVDVRRKATESVLVFIVSKLSKYVSTLQVAHAKLLGEKEHLYLIALEEKARRMSPQDQAHNVLVLSCCCCTKPSLVA